MLDALHLRWVKASGGYQLIRPTADDLEIWKHKVRGLSSMGGPAKPMLRLVPKGKPVPYEIDLKGAMTALKLIMSFGLNPAGADDFYNAYGPLYAIDKLYPDDLGHFRSREIWEQGETMDEWNRSIKGLTELFRLAQAKGKSSLIPAFDASNLGACRMRLYQPHGRSTPLLRLEPQSLRAMLWLAGANAIAGEGKVKSCVVCGKLMIVGGGYGSYASKQTCSARCRVARSRAKKQKL